MRKRKAMLMFMGGAVLVTFLLVAGWAGLAQEPPELPKAEIGAKLPEFTMTDHTGKEHSLSAYAGKVVVLNFSSQECPYSRGVDPHLADLAKEYKDKGVVVLCIDSHNKTTVDEIKKYAEDHSLPFPILKDEKNVYADAVGATRTPEFYVLDKEQKLVYHGPFDDRKDPAKRGETEYLRNALDKTLAGEDIVPSQVKAWGCTIKRVPKTAD